MYGLGFASIFFQGKRNHWKTSRNSCLPQQNHSHGQKTEMFIC